MLQEGSSAASLGLAGGEGTPTQQLFPAAQDPAWISPLTGLRRISLNKTIRPSFPGTPPTTHKPNLFTSSARTPRIPIVRRSFRRPLQQSLVIPCELYCRVSPNKKLSPSAVLLPAPAYTNRPVRPYIGSQYHETSNPTDRSPDSSASQGKKKKVSPMLAELCHSV